jgi:hypothetical protein
VDENLQPSLRDLGFCSALFPALRRGYRIEEKRPIPVNGLCSFVAVKEEPASDPVGELVAQALNGQRASRGGY